VADRLHVVAVEVAKEDAVVARVVLGPLPGSVQDLGFRLDGSAMDGFYDVAIAA